MIGEWWKKRLWRGGKWKVKSGKKGRGLERRRIRDGVGRPEGLWAYDFNLAFDPDFDRKRFFETHVFGKMLKQWPEGFRRRMEPRLETAFGALREIFDELLKEWLHVDGDETLPVQLDEAWIASVLRLPFSDPEAFWKLA